MSHFLDRLTYFRRTQEKFSDGHGITTDESREWEDAYRKRWAADKIVRSTHGVNCTGSCSWKIYVKGGIVTWETQQTDYPRTRPDLPNHEPRGCPRGASYSWYLYSGTRIKYPLVRARLIRHWREARETMTPVAAWQSIVQDPDKRRDWVAKRGRGGFVRVGWDEVTELIAAANAYTIKEYGPDRIAGFSPIPAMSMISYAAGSRYLSLIGGTLLSFYDWYCDLPPSSPQTWGEQTDVPESADWYNAGFLLVWGSNIPMTRAPDAHFYSEVRYRGAKSVVIAPDFNEAAKFSDMWLHPKQGTDAALALALGHVVLREFHVERQAEYFADYTRRYSDFPLLVKLVERDGRLVPTGCCARPISRRARRDANNPTGRLSPSTNSAAIGRSQPALPGFAGAIQGKWNLEERTGTAATSGCERRSRSIMTRSNRSPSPTSALTRRTTSSRLGTTMCCATCPGQRDHARRRRAALVATVFDLFCANYGVDRGFGGENVAGSYDDDVPFTPAWARRSPGVPRQAIIQVAREFAANAETTKGRSMVILGAGLNHWYHMDMSYRGIIALLVMCGCVGQSGGGWAHYVGQEKLRPQTGWLPLAFALDWTRPPRQMNGTSFFYAHTDQWRYETLKMSEILSPLAPEGDWSGSDDRLQRQGRAHGLAALRAAARRQPHRWGKHPRDADGRSGEVDRRRAQIRRPQARQHRSGQPRNWPRNMFFWRSNVLGASGKGHEYFLKHLVGSLHGVIGTDEEAAGLERPKEVVWHDEAPGRQARPDGQYRLPDVDHQRVYSDIVLPTATWYEKHDLNTSDMHPFIHPLTAAVDPAWESKSDWNIFRAIAKKFSDVAPEVLGVEHDVVRRRSSTTRRRARPALRAEGLVEGRMRTHSGQDDAERRTSSSATIPRPLPASPRWGRCSRSSATAPRGSAGTPSTRSSCSAISTAGCRRVPTKGRPKIDTDIDACETILMLAPETNGEVAVKAWEALSKRPAATTPISPRARRRRRSASATSSRSRARSSPRRSGQASRARRSATTPATPTCTS
jgi:nitrate reductase / nitrite oxidoreductase, alpha subunit